MNAPARPVSLEKNIRSMRFGFAATSQGLSAARSSDAAAAARLASISRISLRIRTRRNHALLRAAQFGRRDHFHGLGDLLRVLDRADAPPEIDQTRHSRLSFGPGCRGRAPVLLEPVLQFVDGGGQFLLQRIVERLLLADRRSECRASNSRGTCRVPLRTGGSLPPPDRPADPWWPAKMIATCFSTGSG